MATDWGPVVQTGIGAVAALVGGFIGAWWQARTQQRVERARRLERAADVLASVMSLLEDMQPRWFKYPGPTDRYDVAELQHKREAIGRQLLVLAASHPSARVRLLTLDLDQAVGDALTNVDVLVDAAQAKQPNVEDLVEQAVAAHEKARALLLNLLDAI